MNFSIQSIYNWYRNTLRNPKYRWWIILGTVVYLISPIDILPDFIPVAGQIDDITVLTLLIAEVSQLLIERVKLRKPQPTEVVNESTSSNPNTVDVDAVSFK